MNAEDRAFLQYALRNVFQAFVDPGRFAAGGDDAGGSVDLREFVSGFGLLCAGESFDKLAGAFDLFDTDGDGCVDEDEFRAFLTPLFRIVVMLRAQASDDPAATREAARVVARCTADAARNCFATADLDNDTLSFSEFRMWYNSGAGKQVLPWVDALSW